MNTPFSYTYTWDDSGWFTLIQNTPHKTNVLHCFEGYPGDATEALVKQISDALNVSEGLKEQNRILVEALTESRRMLQWHLDKSQPFNRYDQSDFFNGTANAITQAETILQSIQK